MSLEAKDLPDRPDEEELAHLRGKVTALERENADLRIALETTASHGDCIEEQLQTSLTAYRRHQDWLETVLARVARQKNDIEQILQTTIDHSTSIESELFDMNRSLQAEIHQRRETETKLQSLVHFLSHEKDDLEGILRLIVEHGDAMAEHWYARAIEADALAVTDGLTQVANRRRFDEYLQQQWLTLQERGGTIALILADIDEFKSYNDSLGHPAGDHCLQQVASAIERMVRSPSDLVARYGGEEFAIILPHSGPEPALRVAERIRQAVQRLQLPHPRSTVHAHVTLSLGVATLNPNCHCTPEMLVEMADQALYRAKDRGRNRVVCESAIGPDLVSGLAANLNSDLNSDLTVDLAADLNPETPKVVPLVQPQRPSRPLTMNLADRVPIDPQED